MGWSYSWNYRRKRSFLTSRFLQRHLQFKCFTLVTYKYRSIIFSFILDLCTTNKMINNNNKTNKTIWSPASSCEEENEMKMASGNGLACHTCQRHFGSPTKLELHYRKVHNHPASSSEPSVASKASRKERVFKVCYVYRYTGTLSCISEWKKSQYLFKHLF